MQIETLMSRPAACCTVHDTLSTAAGMMWDHDCGALPVVNDEGVVVGMITDRDICMAAYTQGTGLDSIPVTTAMAKQVFCAGPEEDTEKAERLMAEKQIRRIPIVDNQSRPVGILSLNDLARATEQPGKVKEAPSKVMHTLASVCRPRTVEMNA
jgi:CBS domain-containing protein